jgi:hypothetical protein
MKTMIRWAGLAGLVVLLADCGGGGTAQTAQGCTQIPEHSAGPCRVGLSPHSYYDDSWKSQPRY